MTHARKYLRLFSLCFFLLSLATAPVFAQTNCPEDQDWLKCLEDLLNKTSTFDFSSAEEKAEGKVEDTVQEALVGAASGEEFNLEDFISSLLANLDIDELDSDEGRLRFKKNYQWQDGTLAVALEAGKGELFPELRMKLEEAEQNDLIQNLDDELESFDDAKVSFMFSFDRFGADNKNWWGRRFRYPNGDKTPNGELAGELMELIKDKSKIRLDASKAALNDATTDLHKALGANGSKKIKDTATADQAKIFAAIDGLVAAEKSVLNNFNKAVTDNRFFEFNKLVANQPQFVVSVGRTFRDDSVGRDDFTANVKYERGQANVNGLRESIKKDCDGTLTVECYTDYLTAKKTTLQKNWRISFEGSYTWTDDYEYTSPDGMVSLALDEAEAWDISFSAGRSLRLDKEGMEITRFDFEANYEDVTGDSMKQGRLVSTANFTQKINETMSLAVGLVWASKPEYRGEVEEELSARAGIRVRLASKDD